MIVFESEMIVFESEMIVFESEMIVFESNTDFFVCGFMLYSSIAYGLLRYGAVCSGLPVEPAPNTLSAAFLMNAERAEKVKKRKKRSGNIYLGAFLRAALGLRFLKRIWGLFYRRFFFSES
jgi:hypothetical protein